MRLQTKSENFQLIKTAKLASLQLLKLYLDFFPKILDNTCTRKKQKAYTSLNIKHLCFLLISLRPSTRLDLAYIGAAYVKV